MTEQVGQLLLAVEAATVERIEQELPPEPEQAERRLFEVDGAMLHGTDGAWHEMRHLVIGTPVVSEKQGAPVVQLTEQSYYARVCDAETFTQAALGEMHRRGVGSAHEAGTVGDGATWVQTFADVHRPDAVRVLDVSHAAEHLGVLEEAVRTLGVNLPASWHTTQRHELVDHGPAALLAACTAIEEAVPGLAVMASPAGSSEKTTDPLPSARESGSMDDQPAEPGARNSARREIAYFRKRATQMDYPALRAAGWPIGSGAVESAHIRVMQERMKGSGMRWNLTRANAVLALRCANLSGRWDPCWQTYLTERMRQHAARQAERRTQRLVVRLASLGLTRLRYAPAGGTPSLTDQDAESAAPIASPVRSLPKLLPKYSWRQPFLTRQACT
ncbi:hypothetical protein [Metallibacterium sp.]